MLTQRKALLLVTFLLLCCALLNTRYTSWLAAPVMHTVNTLQYPADRIANSLRTDPPLPAVESSKETLALLLEKERTQNEALWDENERLKKQIEGFEAIYEYTDRKSVKLVEARVSRYNGDPINPTMLVLRGSLHGLKPEDAVAFNANLVGFVTDRIGPSNTTVSLITRKGFSIGVQIKPPPDPENPDKQLPAGWPFKTRVKSDGKGAFYCDLKQDIADELRPGDYVRVSDMILDSANGFLLGLIAKIEPSQDDPLNLSRVTIRPRMPIGPQRMVTILTERTD